MRRILVSLAIVAMVSAHASVAYGAKPLPKGQPVANGQPPNDTQLSEVDAESAVILAQKLGIADQTMTVMRDAAAGQSEPDIQPNVFCEGTGTCTPSGTPTSRILSVYARQQVNGYYCGPASGQVASNRSWSIFNSVSSGNTTSNNKYTQATIATWMSTTTSGTTGANLAGKTPSQSGGPTGLNKASLLPSGFVYLYQDNGGTVQSLYSKLITDVYEYNMVMVLPVKPHDPGASAWLTSWPSAVTAWHWISVHGYYKFYNSATPRDAIAYYADSAGGYSGKTGKFTDPIVDLYYVNERNSGNVVW